MSTGNTETSRRVDRLLVSSPDTAERLRLSSHFESMGYEVSLAHDMKACRELFAREIHDVAVVVHNPDTMNCIDLLQASRDVPHAAGIVVLANRGTIEDAVEAMQLGALDFVCSPMDLDRIALAVKRALVTVSSFVPREKKGALLHSQAHSGHAAPRGEGDRYQILTRSPTMMRLLHQAESVAPSKATVLIQGESGTGKELLARHIHRYSDRANGPFVALNCAALPESLLESELFGHEKGAFSGAINRKPGRFELANNGTLLLDEVTEMALSLQAKLLRVLQEGEVDRLGGSAPIPVDVRIVATTNRDVLAAVRAGHFREDLYFRLNVIPLKLPPLRGRPEDIGFLAEKFRTEFAQEYRKNGLRFAEGVLRDLHNRNWSGNVRELRNIVERGVLLAPGEEITLQDMLGEDDLQATSDRSVSGANVSKGDVFNLGELEREIIKRALAKTEGNRTHAARLLGISVRTLRNKLAEYRQMGLVL
jgi:DNA-binding NtrC family response regulator